MLKTSVIALIGAGQMGEALLRGLFEKNFLGADKVLISDVSKERTESLSEKYGVSVAKDNREAVGEAQTIILAVKPQNIAEVLGEVADRLNEDKLVISIAAGVPTKKIENLIGRPVPVVRVMPNAPALVGEAMSALSPGKFAGDEHLSEAKMVLGAVGQVVEVPEEQLNAVTAVSGSGPAYFYLLVEELIDCAEQVGIDRDVAQRLVIQTIVGAAAMLKETGKSPENLRLMVTSPGGTTEAALEIFREADFSEIVRKAIKAAVRRAEELAG